MSENKNFKIIKTTPNDVLFIIHPISNPSLSRKVYLTDRNPVQPLPLDWALGVFQDEGVYSLYKNKAFTFDDNESLVKLAYEGGVYFDDKLNFVPAIVDQTGRILEILKAGNRANIMSAIDEYGKELVQSVAVNYANDLTQAVIRMLEGIFKVQLVMDGE